MGNLTNKLCFLMVIIEVSPIVLSFRTISYLDCMCFFIIEVKHGLHSDSYT